MLDRGGVACEHDWRGVISDQLIGAALRLENQLTTVAAIKYTLCDFAIDGGSYCWPQ